MEIAYYSFGNVDRPLGKIHDERGAPILMKGEMVLAQDNDAGCEVLKVGGGLMGVLAPTIVFPDIGTGELYRTDRRYIYLRVPPLSRYAEAREAWIDNPLEFAERAKEWLKEGFREAVSIPVREVKKTVRKKKDRLIVLHVRHGGERYLVRLTPSIRPFL